MTGKLEEIELSESLSSAHGMEHSPKRATQFSPMSPFRMNSPALLNMKSGRSSKDMRGSAAAAGTNEWDAAEDPCLSERMVMYVAKRKVGLEMNPL